MVGVLWRARELVWDEEIQVLGSILRLLVLE